MRRLLVVALVVVACSPNDGTSEQTTTSSTTTSTLAATTTEPIPTTTTSTIPPDFGVTSPAFEDGAEIPALHTCEGADLSPELDIVGIPENTRSLAMIVDDPDAPLGTWIHWVEFDITTDSNSLVVPRDVGQIGVQGVNSWNIPGYRGPCPPEGEEHLYEFRVYALDSLLDLPSGVDSAAVRDAMDGHVIDSVLLTGLYGRG